MSSAVIITVGLVLLVVLLPIWSRRFLITCGPDEILVFVGRSHVMSDGSIRGYRVVLGGRSNRIPVLEDVYRIDTRPMSIGLRPDGAKTKDDVKLTVLATARVAISRDETLVHNAVHCFLTIKREMIKPVARKAIEKRLSKALAEETQDDINRNLRAFAKHAQKVVGEDLAQLGLEVDIENLQIL